MYVIGAKLVKNKTLAAIQVENVKNHFVDDVTVKSKVVFDIFFAKLQFFF